MQPRLHTTIMLLLSRKYATASRITDSSSGKDSDGMRAAFDLSTREQSGANLTFPPNRGRRLEAGTRTGPQSSRAVDRKRLVSKSCDHLCAVIHKLLRNLHPFSTRTSTVRIDRLSLRTVNRFRARISLCHGGFCARVACGRNLVPVRAVAPYL